MRKIKRTTLKWVSISLLLIVGAAFFFQYAADQPPDLEKINCHPNDFGSRFYPSVRAGAAGYPQLTATAVATHSVNLAEHNLTYLVIDCTIFLFENEQAAHQAFDLACADQITPPVTLLRAGDELCDFVGSAPFNVAFRSGEYLVLMSGDAYPFPIYDVAYRLDNQSDRPGLWRHSDRLQRWQDLWNRFIEGWF